MVRQVLPNMSSQKKNNVVDARAKPWQFKGLRRLPHFSLFAIVNLGYCGPVLLAYLLGFSEGGVDAVLDLETADIVRFMAVYVASVVAFFMGAWVVSRVSFRVATLRLNRLPYAQFRRGAPLGLRAMVVLLSIALLISKILLIPSGVYSQYIFDGELGAGPVWTTSMFLSETLIIFLIGLVVAERSIGSLYFIGGFLCLSTNLLHGTRIFDAVTVIGIVVYFWIEVGFSRRILIYTLAGVLAMVGVLYLAFANRTTYHYSADANALTVFISPVAYEAVFSQMSLLGFLKAGQITLYGHPLDFLLDTISWLTPRFINPDKDSGGLLHKYADLAPLGAFSGPAAGLVYFGYSMFIYYFLVGALGSWLQRRAKTNPINFIIYVYFCADILFRMMRDGLIFPIKYMANGVLVLIISVYLFEHLKTAAKRQREALRTTPPAIAAK